MQIKKLLLLQQRPGAWRGKSGHSLLCGIDSSMKGWRRLRASPAAAVRQACCACLCTLLVLPGSAVPLSDIYGVFRADASPPGGGTLVAPPKHRHQAVIPPTMPVFVIGMIPDDGRQSARLNLFHRSFQASDLRQLPLHVVRAVNGSTVPPYSVLNVKSLAELEQGEAIGYRTNHGQLSRGAIGAHMSHVRAWLQLLRSGASYGLILEDDMAVDEDLMADLQMVMPVLPPGWHMLHLRPDCHNCTTEPHFVRVHSFSGLMGYIITADAVIKLLELGAAGPIRYQVDFLLSVMATKGLLDIYTLPEGMVVRSEHKYGSDIQHSNTVPDGSCDVWQAPADVWVSDALRDSLTPFAVPVDVHQHE